MLRLEIFGIHPIIMVKLRLALQVLIYQTKTIQTPLRSKPQ